MASLLPVLTFHDINKRPSVISISPGVFQRSIARLHDNGFRALSLMEVADVLNKSIQFPDRSFAITFDDGYRSVYKESFPVLQRYDMSATVFLTVGENAPVKPSDRLPSLNGRPMLSWHEIREMQQAGIDFGAHTCTHPNLTSLPIGQVKAEICDSKKIIEDALGARVFFFAYPYGCYNLQIRTIVQQHFTCAYSVKLSMITKRSDLYALERVDAYYLRTDRLFRRMLTKLFPWYLLARNIPRSIRRTLDTNKGKR